MVRDSLFRFYEGHEQTSGVLERRFLKLIAASLSDFSTNPPAESHGGQLSVD